MITFTALNIAIDFAPEHDVHNKDFVGYIIQRYPHKVVKGTILTRASVDHWYKESLVKYPDDRYTYLVASVSLIGEIVGTTEVKKDAVKPPYGASTQKDPSAN